MRNVFNEIEDRLKVHSLIFEDIGWASIKLNHHKRVELKPDWKPSEMEVFKTDLKKLGNYDSGYGAQNLYGWIVFKNGAWMERHEYDGSEWWEYKSTPTWSKREKEVYNYYA